MQPTPSVSPDFNPLASHFDRFLPHIHPVSLAVLERLPALAAGSTVLDVACGTGEPGLTLARRSPGIRLLGVDQAEALIAAAQDKVAQERLGNARFEVMPMDALQLSAASMDAVISRFGLLMFGDVPAAARELARVLRPGGSFSLAVWDDPAKNTLMSAQFSGLRAHVPEERLAALERLSAWAEPGRRAELLERCGLTPVHSEMFSWEYRFQSFEDPWQMVSGMGKLTGQSDLAPAAQEQVRQAMIEALARYRQADGGYVIPHACRVFWGQRAPRQTG